jgi:hypothetical protein
MSVCLVCEKELPTEPDERLYAMALEADKTTKDECGVVCLNCSMLGLDTDKPMWHIHLFFDKDRN